MNTMDITITSISPAIYGKILNLCFKEIPAVFPDRIKAPQ
jgi:hypothetical protein